MKSRNELLLNLKMILNRIKTFSCPEFDSVFSKAYFEEIVKPSLKNEDSKYAFIFGDFNKLGVINDLYGHDFGDNALNTAMKIIKKSIPSDAIVVRAGGDEIFIVLPDSDINSANACCESIKNNLQSNVVFTAGLSIELAASDSSHGNIDELINLTDNEVTNIKAARKEDNSPADIFSDTFIPLNNPSSKSSAEHPCWEELNRLINISIYEYLQNFRPTKTFVFDKKQITDISNFVINSFITLLNEKTNNNLSPEITSLLSENYSYLPDDVISDDFLEKNLPIYDYSDIGVIHHLVTTPMESIDFNNYSNEFLISLTDSLNNLLERLVRDNTGLLDKQYFRHYLVNELCKSDEEYLASYFTSSGIKLSNFAFDHTFSDMKLAKTNSIVCKEAENKLHYNNNAFEFSSDDVYLISQKGGNYLFLYPKKMNDKIKPKIISIADTVNASYDIKDPNSCFKLSYYCMNEDQALPKSSPRSLIKYVRALKEEANYNKNPLKKDSFNSADAFFAFKKSINNCIDYYLKNIPNATTDISTQASFIKNVYMAFLNQEVLHNETREKKKTFGLNSSHDNLEETER